MLIVDVVKDFWDYAAIAISGLSAVATVLTVVFAASELRRGARREGLAEARAAAAEAQTHADQVRVQANRVFQWTEWVMQGGAGGEVSLTVVNESSGPVFDVVVLVPASWRLLGWNNGVEFPLRVMAPGRHGFAAQLDQEGGDNPPLPPLDVEFTDLAGARWVRRSTGALERAKPLERIQPRT